MFAGKIAAWKRAAKLAAVQQDDGDDEEEALLSAGVRVAPLKSDFTYGLRFVPDGRYFVVGTASFGSGADYVDTFGYLDANGDGKADPVEGVGGKSVANINIPLHRFDQAGGGGGGPQVAQGPISVVDKNRRLLGLQGPNFVVPRADLEVVLPDGRTTTVAQAGLSGQIVKGTRVAVEVQQSQEGPLAAVRIRILGQGDTPPGGPNQLVGAVETADLQNGKVSLAGPLFLLTDGTVFLNEENNPMQFSDLRIGTVVEVEGGPNLPNDELPTAVRVKRVSGGGGGGGGQAAAFNGTLLRVVEPQGEKLGRLVLSGPVFSFDAFGTQVIGPAPDRRRLSVRDLQQSTQVVVLFQESKEPGRPPLAVQIKVLGAGESVPAPTAGQPQFVGPVASINFENNRIQMAFPIAFNAQTVYVDEAGNSLSRADIQPGAQLAVTTAPTQVGVPVARQVKRLRSVDNQPPEQILNAVFVTPNGDVPMKNAIGVPLNAQVRVEFDRPLNEQALESIEGYIYELGEDGEDVELSTRIDGGRLVVEMTLKADTVYEAVIVLENGVEFFAQFSTGQTLPAMEVVSISPENGTSGVATKTSISVTFNRPIDQEDGEVNADLFVLPTPLSGEISSEDLEISADGMTVSVDVELEADRTYLVVVYDAASTDGFQMRTLVKSRFSTGTLGTGRVTANFDNPPGVFLSPNPREWIGYAYLLPDTLDVENLEGDETDRLGVAFDVVEGGMGVEIQNVPAGHYFIEGFMFIEHGPGGTELGLLGVYEDAAGDPIVLDMVEGGTVNVRIKLKSELRLTDSKPKPGQGGVASGRTQLSLQFSEPLQVNRGVMALNMKIDPPIQGFDPRRDLLINREDPRKVEARVTLAANTDYLLTVLYAQGVSGAGLSDVADIPFSTRTQFVAGSIAGKVTLSDGSTPKGSIILGNLVNGRRASEVKVRKDGTYEFANVPEGTYGVFAELTLDDGRKAAGLLDKDQDGKADPLKLAAGDKLAGQDFAVTVAQAPAPGGTGENANATLSFDFDTAKGDGKQSVGQISAGDEFSVAVYAQNVSSLIGYDVKVAFDTTKVTLQLVDEATESEGTSALDQGGGLGAFIGSVGKGTANLSGVILGSSEKVAVSGSGLLGVMQFVALETFTSGETSLSIQSAVMQGLTAADSVKSDAAGTISVQQLTTSIELTADPGIISATGTDSATVQAQLLDLNSVLESSDNSTVVTFSVTGGTGTLSASEVMVTGGVAKVKLTSSTSGTVTVQASATGAKSVTTSVVVQSTSGTVPSGPAGPIALDLNTAAGDQEERTTSTQPKSGETVTVDLVAVSGALDAVGYDLDIRFDAQKLQYKEVKVSDLFSGGLSIPVSGDGKVQISVVLLGKTATKDAGSMGQVTFTVLQDIETTQIVLASASYGRASGTEKLTIGSGGATVAFGVSSSTTDKPTPDFDGDGQVGFRDFVQFAQQYGSVAGDGKYDAKFDLDSSGDIGFRDFVQFAQAYGKPVSSKAALKSVGSLSSPLNGHASLVLTTRPSVHSGEVSVVVGLAEAGQVAGYDLRVSYDASALEWVGAEGLAGSVFVAGDDNHTVAVQRLEGKGEVLLADMLRMAVKGEGDLVRLRFRLLDETVTGRVEVSQALVTDGLGRVEALLGVHAADVRAVPGAFALNQNYPNPFNPETVVPFALPEARNVSMVIYNVLGQQVRVLARGHREAGYHRISWDGRDAQGRTLSSGIYFVRMAAKDFVDVRKMLLIK
ncbi:MAG: Ig-like domain-containing protein [bacterium]|nr:Ig-like domain-containing protein [bacterium]